MVEVDGIKIPKVISIECNEETGFQTYIQFYTDSRIEDTADLEKLDKYSLTELVEESKDDIRTHQIILRQNVDISFTYGRTDY